MPNNSTHIEGGLTSFSTLGKLLSYLRGLLTTTASSPLKSLKDVEDNSYTDNGLLTDKYLKSLVHDKAIGTLYKKFLNKLKSKDDSQSVFLNAIENPNKTIGVDILTYRTFFENQFKSPFNLFTKMLFDRPTELKFATKEYEKVFSPSDIRVLFAIYHEDSSILNSKGTTRTLYIGKTMEGSIKQFYKKTRENFLKSNWAQTVFEFKQSYFVKNNITVLQVHKYIDDLLTTLNNLEIGEYTYQITVINNLSVSNFTNSQHYGLLVDESTGLMMEVTSFKEADESCIRPTSFVCFMERAGTKSSNRNSGIYCKRIKKWSINVEPYFLQRSIQLIGTYKYNAVNLNCFTFTNWVCTNTFVNEFFGSLKLDNTNNVNFTI